MNRYLLILMLFFGSLAPYSVFAQSAQGNMNPWPDLSLSLDRLPFGKMLTEVQDRDELAKINQFVSELGIHAPDSSANDTLHKSQNNRWRLKHLLCSSQKGWTDRSMVYNMSKTYSAFDLNASFSYDEIIAGFSQDSLLTMDSIIYTQFPNVPYDLNIWHSVKHKNMLLIYMYRSAPFDRPFSLFELSAANPVISVETCNEDYWYLFEMCE